MQMELREAISHYKNGQFDEAERLYRMLLAQAPGDAYVLYLLGALLYQRGNHAAAARSFQDAVDHNPTYAAAFAALGLALQGLGRLDSALPHYERALALEPNSPGVLHNRGIALVGLQRPADALASFDRALAIKPGDPQILCDRGKALLDLNQPEAAVASLERALAISPDFVEALNNLGNALLSLKQNDEALAALDRALALEPRFTKALNNRGNVLWALGRPAEALASYDAAVEIDPEFAEAFFNRGNVFLKLKQFHDALVSYEHALALKPNYVEALRQRGAALWDLKKPEDALASYERSIELRPDYAEALNDRGNALRKLSRYKEALKSYERAITVCPAYADALNNRGVVLSDLGLMEDALKSLDQAIAISPDFAEAFGNRGNVLFRLKRVSEAALSFAQWRRLQPDSASAAGCLLNCLLQSCDWEQTAELIAHVTTATERGEVASAPFSFLAISVSPAAQLRCAQTHVDVHYPPPRTPMWNGQRYGHGRIRLAYLSADFYEHATAHLTAGLFEAHDRQRFEIHGISLGPATKSEMRERLRSAFTHFSDVRDASDRDVATMLREREIDIVVDLNGFTSHGRPGIFAHRPAPLQVNYLGYPGTLGADFIDYIIADPRVIPAEHERFYTESIVRLPDSYQVNDRKRRIAERTPARAEVGLPDEGFVFCCFNNSYKITPQMFTVWMRLLQRVPGSVLWLLEDNPLASRNLRREAELRQVAAKRLVFATRMKLDDHLARHRLADLFLDTLPYNAHTTASDALWAGLPVVTCMGDTFAGRVAGSLLTAADLPELITHGLDEYEALATKLATMPSMLAAARTKLGRNREASRLFDTDRFCRHIEAAYTMMWKRHQDGHRPTGFCVEPLA